MTTGDGNDERGKSSQGSRPRRARAAKEDTLKPGGTSHRLNAAKNGRGGTSH